MPVGIALVPFALSLGCSGSDGDGTSSDAQTNGPMDAIAPTASAPVNPTVGPSGASSTTPGTSATSPRASDPPTGAGGSSSTPIADPGAGGEHSGVGAGGAGLGGEGNGGRAGDQAAGASGQASGQPGGDSGGSSGSGPTVGGGVAGEAGTAGLPGLAGMPNLGGGGVGGAPTSDCDGGKVVHFVYFVEADQPYSESQHSDIERQAYAFQQYWYDQLGATFYLNQPVVDVIEADNDSSWYLDTPDGIHDDSRWYRLGNVKNEVYDKLGISDFDADHRVVNYPTTRHDGRVGGNFGGAWMDGDDMTCIADDGPTYPYDDGAVAHCMGHPAHEFGHVLGLDHEGPDDDCMQYGFYTQTVAGMCTFSDANVQKILANSNNEGWFEASPGETCRGR